MLRSQQRICRLVFLAVSSHRSIITSVRRTSEAILSSSLLGLMRSSPSPHTPRRPMRYSRLPRCVKVWVRAASTWRRPLSLYVRSQQVLSIQGRCSANVVMSAAPVCGAGAGSVFCCPRRSNSRVNTSCRCDWTAGPSIGRITLPSRSMIQYLRADPVVHVCRYTHSNCWSRSRPRRGRP